MLTMDLKETIFALCRADGASGNEGNAAETALSMLREYCPEAEIIHGNVIGTLGETDESKPTLVLDAHIDQVGFIVTYMTDDGFIKVGDLGGIDRRLLPAQNVTVHGKRDIKGVICSVPPHLSDGEKVLKMSDVAVDCGMSKAELEEIVSPGDTITYDIDCRELLGQRITARSLDDRCGVAAILLALDILKEHSTAYNVTVIFSSQEELGERGAKIGAFRIDPDIALAVDVSFGLSDSEEREKCGELGKGAMIGISPCLSRDISDRLISTARVVEIPYQIEVMNGSTGTNVDRYSVNREGAKTCTISIPLRNMHTPAEVIDLRDVRAAAELIAEFVKETEE